MLYQFEPLRLRHSGRFWLVEFKPESARRWKVIGRFRSKMAAQSDLIACLPIPVIGS